MSSPWAMLMTPMTPKVIASPMAASTSTEPWLRPNSSVCTMAYSPRCRSIVRSAATAAARTRGSDSP